MVSDVVDLGGTAGDVFVLELGYDESAMSGVEAMAAATGNLYLAWLDDGVWKNAIEGNAGANTSNPALLNYQGSWLASGAGLTLGAWGVDIAGNVVWAVLDHNSEFAASEAESVPEPSAIALALFGLLMFPMLAWRRRERP